MSKEKSFSKMLKENNKKIRVLKGDQEMQLSDVVAETIDGIMATSIEGLIPVTAAEAAEESLDSKMMGIGVNYAQPIFSLYSSTIKYGTAKQTLMITLPANEADYIFRGGIDDLDALKTRTDLPLILDKIPEKVKKKITKFEESSDVDNDLFIVKIPDVVMFYDVIKKKEASKSKLFDIVIILVKTKKDICKIKRKNKQLFNDISSAIVENSVKIITDLGISCVHLKIDSRFYDDPHDYASTWVKYLDADASKKILSRINFCTDEPDTLAQFNAQVRAELSVNKGMESL